MVEIHLDPINTVAVAAAVTTTDESYVRQALADGRLTSHPGKDGETLVSLEQLREILRSDGLKE